MKHSNGRVKFLPARRVGRHSKAPFCRSYGKLKRVIGIAIFVLGATVATVLFGVLSGMAANASVTPAARTCAAFKAWDHARTGANLNALMTASEAAPWALYGTDTVVLYTDVRDRDAIDTQSDIRDLRADCE